MRRFLVLAALCAALPSVSFADDPYKALENVPALNRPDERLRLVNYRLVTFAMLTTVATTVTGTQGTARPPHPRR